MTTTKWILLFFMVHCLLHGLSYAFQQHSYRRTTTDVLGLIGGVGRRSAPLAQRHQRTIQTVLSNDRYKRIQKQKTNPSEFPTIVRSRTTTRLYGRQWEGDDVRPLTWMKRRLKRRQRYVMKFHQGRSSIITFHWLVYCYQIFTTILKVKRRYPTYWNIPSRAVEIIFDSIWGSSVMNTSPIVQSFGFSVARASFEKFRYLTGGFIHGGLLHLILTTYLLTSSQPSWMESLGLPLYLTTYIAGIIGGNILQTATAASSWDFTLCLGPSAGICALLGLSLTQLLKMGRGGGSGSYRQIFQGIVGTIAMGWFMDSVSNTCNIGGIIAGMVLGILCGPSYVTDYAMRRKNSVEFDPTPRDYRQVMGFGIMPTRGLLPLSFLWIVAGIFVVTNPQYRAMPSQIIKALLRPL